MKEELVQWTLLNNPEYLSKCLSFPIAKKIGQEITTDFGRIDFVLENWKQEQLIVELETNLDSSAKLDYCFDQILRYRSVRFVDKTKYCILFADETPQNNVIKIEKFGNENDILIHSYSLDSVIQFYSDTVERLSLNVGLALPNPKNYTICYLRWLNKILKPFKDLQKDKLTQVEIFRAFKGGATNFRCYKRLALDFEMIDEKNDGFHLTQNGKEYLDNFNPYINVTCPDIG